MRIAFDLDGVLADLHTPFARTAFTLFPELDPKVIGSAEVGASPPDDAAPADDEDLTAPPPLLSVPVNRRQSEAIWRHLSGINNFWETLDEIEPGAIARLAAIAEERDWEVIFITSRPSSEGRTIQRQSQRWLERKGFTLPSTFVVHGSRGRVAEALRLDVVVDDRPDNCLDVVLESKAGAVLIWRGPQQTVPGSAKRLGIAVSHTVGTCLDTLIEAEKADSEGKLLDRMRRLFGLKTKSASPLLRR